MQGHLTAVLGGLITIAPQFMTFLPAPYQMAATGLLGFLTGIYHLYHEPPK